MDHETEEKRRGGDRQYPDDGLLHPNLSDFGEEVLEAFKPAFFPLIRLLLWLYLGGLLLVHYVFGPAEGLRFLTMPDERTLFWRIGLALAIMAVSWVAQRQLCPRREEGE